MIEHKSKAETLEFLAPVLKTARVLPLFRFSSLRWQEERADILKAFGALDWSGQSLIVRSSAASEDADNESCAGHFLSLAHVVGEEALAVAVDQVVDRFERVHEDDQVFVQPFLTDAQISGVAFSHDPNTNAPYIVINFDETGDTGAVTSGQKGALKTHIRSKRARAVTDPRLAPVVDLIFELEELLGSDHLDIEFAFDRDGALYLFQVRPLANKAHGLTPCSPENHELLLQDIETKIAGLIGAHPLLPGKRTMFGNMPDWNPAEIIGTRPRPLSLSLYKELITDSIWAYQRNNYGYKNLRSFPLLHSFHGQPYIDIRVSFNSFLPRGLDEDLGNSLIDYYLDRLQEKPALHDKVEFDIIFSCYTPDIHDRIKVLGDYGFSDEDQAKLIESLHGLTERIIHSTTGLWQQDLNKLPILVERHRRVMDSDLDKISKIYWLLEDCKRYGTLPFAGLARAGFIAVQFLQSMVNAGVLPEDEFHSFMESVETVSSTITQDFHTLSREAFLERYGHLRPGTYDILSPRYDEEPDLYFDWTKKSATASAGGASSKFVLSDRRFRVIHEMLRAHNLTDDVDGLMDFLRKSIEGREYGKFLFTRNLSDALSLIKELGADYGISADDISYASIHAIYDLYASSNNVEEALRRSITAGKSAYEQTQRIMLPPLITSPDDIWAFDRMDIEPNYITLKSVSAKVTGDLDRTKLAGTIVMIPNADPGFDWIFTHQIAGLITAYGGANSHMAIRAGELGLPAVIGVGEEMFARWCEADTLHIDCSNRTVQVVRCIGGE